MGGFQRADSESPLMGGKDDGFYSFSSLPTASRMGGILLRALRPVNAFRGPTWQPTA